MAHLALFKKFDQLKNIGDSFTMSLTNYKNLESARGTITSAATDYRRSGKTDFHVHTEKVKNNLKVTRVENGKNGNHEIQNCTILTKQMLTSLTKQFPHDADVYIAEMKIHLIDTMKPFDNLMQS